MSLYELLAVCALLGVGCFAYYLYRKDMRPKPPGEKAPENRLMFARDPQDQDRPPKV
jgi:hypothetical protein